MDVSRALAQGGLAADRPLGEGVRPAAWGTNGKHWVFVYESPTADQLAQQLDAVRLWVNGPYRMPRAMRLSSPVMVLIALSDDVDDAVEALVRASPTSGWMGGEIYYLVSVALSADRVVFPEPRGTRNQRAVEAVRFRLAQPDQWVSRVLG